MRSMRAGDLSSSDVALLVSALEAFSHAPKTYAGRSTSDRSAIFSAKYNGLCERCGFPIKVGQDIRYHNDFSGVVHSGCRAPDVTTRLRFRTTARVVRQPVLCPASNLEHAGEC
jgi:hypothetical protein